MRAALRLLHRALGLLFGAVFLAVCLSGAILVFEDELIDALDREMIVRSGSAMDADQFYLATLAKLGEGEQVKRLYVPLGKVRVKGASEQRILYFDPRDGRYLGQGTRVLDQVLAFHRRLLLSEPGRWITLCSALSALALVLSGLQLWWPRSSSRLRSHFRIKTDGSRRRFLFDLHRVGGVASAAIILILVVTGLNYSKVSGPYRTGLSVVSGGSAALPSPPRVPLGEGTLASLKGALDKAQSEFPGYQVTSVDPPQSPEEPLTIRLRGPGQPGDFGRTVVYLNPWSGEVLGKLDASQLNPAQSWVNVWALPIHRGRAFGPLHQLLWLVGALVGAMLPLTGAWLWWNKRRRASQLPGRPEESDVSNEPT